VSLSHLLVVDDSAAVVGYIVAALESHYRLTTASTGREALERMRLGRPDGVLLDLSMPELSGDEVLAIMQRDEALRTVPVIVVSSEKERAEECLRHGAVAFLPKPVRADALRQLVDRVLGEAARRRQAENLTVLFGSVGEREVAVPLSSVRTVVLQPATRSIDIGASYISRVFELEGQPVGLVRMARALRAEHQLPVEDRKCLVVSVDGALLALCFDKVSDPEEIAPQNVVERGALAGLDDRLLGRAVRAVVTSERGPRAVVEPRGLISRQALRRLASAVQQVGRSPGSHGPAA